MQKNVRPFGIRDKIGYAAGDVANNFTFTLVSSFLCYSTLTYGE